MMTVTKKAAFLLLIVLIAPSLWAQNRFALVIGNAHYPDEKNWLPNAINDTDDISAALLGLGYDVVPRQDLGYQDMIREIENFINRLKNNRNSEGFFWYAGHAYETKEGESDNFLLPLDVNCESEGLLKGTSFSVAGLMKQLEGAGNKINIVVLDACRVPPAVGDVTRSYDDTSRILRTVPQVPPDFMLIYSTAPGTRASDGAPGKRNSPFAEAFLKNMNSTEPLSLVINDIFKETMDLTNNRQSPDKTDRLVSDPRYSLNPAGVQPASSPASVSDGLEYEIVGGRSITIIRYTGNATTVNIPAYIQGLPVTAIGDLAFSDLRNITSITIPSLVTSIGAGAFFGCSILTSITIPSSVTAIGIRAFFNCSSLTRITIPSSVTSIGLGAFAACSSLTSITIPSSVTAIGDETFGACYSLISITIPSSVTSIGLGAFISCRSLSSVTIPSSVTSIGSGAFHDCISLTNITVDSRNPAYASIDGVLFDKSIGALIKYPEGKIARTYAIPPSVTFIGDSAFSDSSFTIVTIPSSVTVIGHGGFSGCGNLTSITIPSSVTAIGNYAFYYCDNLTSVSLSRRTQVGQNAFPATTQILYRD